MRERREDWRPPWLESIRRTWSLNGQRWRIGLRCWKDRLCSGCGGAYRYLSRRAFRPAVVDEGHALALAEEHLEGLFRSHDNPVPCPHCGLVQPREIGRRRLYAHLVLAGLLGLLPFIFFVPATESMGGLVWDFAVAVFLLALGQLAVLAWRPNRNLGGNRARAEALVREGEMVPLEPPAKDYPPSGWHKDGRSWLRAASVLCLVLAPLVAALPEAVRLGLGWRQHDGVKPLVVGPGDQVRLSLPSHSPWMIYAAEGLWRGDADVEVLNAADLGLPGTKLTATSNTETWGGSIQPKGDRGPTIPNLWVKVLLPDRPGLEGKTIHLRVTLKVTYPEQAGNNFVNRQTTRERTFELVLAAPAAGRRYKQLCEIACPAGLGLAGLGVVGVCVAAALHRRIGFPGTLHPFPPEGRAPLPEAGPDERIRPQGEHTTDDERGPPPDQRYRPDR